MRYLQVLVDSAAIDLVPRLKPTGAGLSATRERNRVAHAEMACVAVVSMLRGTPLDNASQNSVECLPRRAICEIQA